MNGLTGHYEQREVTWHDVGVENCEVCGRLLLRRVWRFADPNRGPVLACSPDCESLWFNYLGPRISSGTIDSRQTP